MEQQRIFIMQNIQIRDLRFLYSKQTSYKSEEGEYILKFANSFERNCKVYRETEKAVLVHIPIRKYNRETEEFETKFVILWIPKYSVKFIK